MVFNNVFFIYLITIHLLTHRLPYKHHQLTYQHFNNQAYFGVYVLFIYIYLNYSSTAVMALTKSASNGPSGSQKYIIFATILAHLMLCFGLPPLDF